MHDLNQPHQLTRSPPRRLSEHRAANRQHPFVFITNRDVRYTNNVSERHPRPSVIFRKVTNRFRCEWGAEIYATFRSIVGTAKAKHASVPAAPRFALAAKTPARLPASPG
jgi:hypothetical protein